MHNLSDLVQPSLNALMDRIDNWLIQRRQKAIVREIQVLERNIDNDLKAIGILQTEEINLRNQLYLPQGIHL